MASASAQHDSDASASASTAAPGAPPPTSPPRGARAAPVHLFVLQHGLWGSNSCVSNLEQFLRQQLQKSAGANAGADAAADAADAAAEQEEEVLIINSEVNKKVLTYDGIDVCGARVVQMVLEAVASLQDSGRQVTKMSFVGYSLGGLILRYTVGNLFVLGLFEEVSCENFITIASPHLGSWREPSSWWARWFNANVAIVGSRAGRQLMLVDSDYNVPWLQHQQARHDQQHASHQQSQQQPQQQKEPNPQEPNQQQQPPELPPGATPGQPVPLLLLMAHPAGPFHAALRGFRTRIVAANIHYDAMVPYCTAALCMRNPYEEALAVPIDPVRYPSVVRPAAAGEDAQELTHKGRNKRLLLLALFSPLAPLLYAWTVVYGVLHHRSVRKQPLEGTWLHQLQQQQQPPAATVKALSSSSGSRKGKQLLQPAGTRASATLAAGTAAAGAEADTGLITTAVEGAAEQEQGSADGGAGGSSSRSSLEQGMQEAAAPAAGGGGGGGGFLRRRRSDSLAAALQQHQQEDELGTLSKQLSSKGSLRLLGLQEQQEQQQADETTGGGTHAGQGPATTSSSSGSAARVTVDRDGIVEAPSVMHQQQAWMAQQLFENMPPCIVPDNSRALSGDAAAGTGSSTGSSSGNSLKAKQQGGSTQQEQQQQVAGAAAGGWHRVAVCTRHFHAHAAIIIRDSRFEGQSRDFFQYLVDHLSL